MHVDIDRFAHLDSPFHRWDQRYKMAGVFLLILVISMLTSLVILCCSVFLALLSILVSRIPPAQAFRTILYPLLLLVPLFIFLPLTAGGAHVSLYGIPVYTGGLLLSAQIAMKALCIITLFNVMMGTSPFTTSMKALRSLKVPSKMVDLIMFTYRYIFIYLDDLRALRQSLILKGYRSRTSRHSFRTSSYLVGSLMVRSFEQTDRMFNAMTCRGYTGEVKTITGFNSTIMDLLKLLTVLLAATMLAVFEMMVFNGKLL